MLARRNLRLGRGDRRGAFRLAGFVFAAWAVAWFFGAHHVPDFDEFGSSSSFWLRGFSSPVSLWVLYIALEPYVRRRWPATLVSWSRLLAGGFRDPLVGRDVLAGCLLGAFSIALVRLGWFVPSWLGYPPPQAIFGSTVAVSRCARTIIADHIEQLDPCAFCLACVSVCPVPSPGLAAQGVGGSGRMGSFVHVLPTGHRPIPCFRSSW